LGIWQCDDNGELLPGQNPGAFGEPGILMETSIYPVVKQSLFHDVIIPVRGEPIHHTKISKVRSHRS
jgi:hypothetical protein